MDDTDRKRLKTIMFGDRYGIDPAEMGDPHKLDSGPRFVVGNPDDFPCDEVALVKAQMCILGSDMVVDGVPVKSGTSVMIKDVSEVEANLAGFVRRSAKMHVTKLAPPTPKAQGVSPLKTKHNRHLKKLAKKARRQQRK